MTGKQTDQRYRASIFIRGAVTEKLYGKNQDTLRERAIKALTLWKPGTGNLHPESITIARSISRISGNSNSWEIVETISYSSLDKNQYAWMETEQKRTNKGLIKGLVAQRVKAHLESMPAALGPASVSPDLPTKAQNPSGLHQRYKVTKLSGEVVHPQAEYFVLRLDEFGKDKVHINACRKAVVEYARNIQGHLPQLAADLLSRYDGPV